jgi:hypothetical protein
VAFVFSLTNATKLEKAAQNFCRRKRLPLERMQKNVEGRISKTGF